MLCRESPLIAVPLHITNLEELETSEEILLLHFTFERYLQADWNFDC